MRRTALVLAFTLPALPALADPARVMAYSDSAFQDNYTAAVLDPYNAHASEADKVGFFGSASSATMLGQLRTQKTDPQVDVVILDTTIAAIACAEGLIEKVTPAMLPVMADLDPQAIDPAGCGPAVTFDNFAVAYNAKTVVPAPTSMSVMADPKWKGRVALSAPPSIIALAMTAILAHADGGDWRKADGAFKTLLTMAPNVQTFDPQPDGYTLILNGTLDFSTGWNARSQLFRDRSNGLLGSDAAKRGDGAADQHDQPGEGWAAPGGRAGVHALRAVARGAEDVYREDVLRPDQPEGADQAGCGGPDRGHAGGSRPLHPGRLERDGEAARQLDATLAARGDPGRGPLSCPTCSSAR